MATRCETGAVDLGQTTLKADCSRRAESGRLDLTFIAADTHHNFLIFRGLCLSHAYISASSTLYGNAIGDRPAYGGWKNFGEPN